MEGQQSVGASDDEIALRHLRAGGGDCFGRLIARWSSFMHVSVYLEQSHHVSSPYSNNSFWGFG